MIFYPRHADLADLADFRGGVLSADEHQRLARHLAGCAQCQASLRFLTRVDAALESTDARPPANLLERIQASRAAGERRILAVPDQATSRSSATMLRRIAATAAAVIGVVIIAGTIMVTRTSDLSAVSAESQMSFSPGAPRMGDTIRVTYRPMSGLFANERKIVLRARQRTSIDDMYADGVPPKQVGRVALLERRPDGSYTGAFVLPDSTVFASLVAENDSATRIDDNLGRCWEILTYARGGVPAFDALKQRANDMMGRSWDEAYASARRLTTLYPDRVGSWALLEFFEGALYGEKGTDRAQRYTARIDSLAEALKAEPHIASDDIGQIFFRMRARLRTGTARDSAAFAYWLDRMIREYPRHSQLSQHYAVTLFRDQWNKKPAWMLDSLETLYSRMAPVNGPGRNLINVALQVANREGNDTLYRHWLQRSLIGAPDSSYRLAVDLSDRPRLRAEGERALRVLLAEPAEKLVTDRGLAETRREFTYRAANARRAALVALGTALAADGRARESIDTLKRAGDGVWDLQIFRSLRRGYRAAGDTAAAEQVEVKIAVDPRTDPDTAASLVKRLRGRFGPARFDSLLSEAHHEMNHRVLGRSKAKTLRSTAHMQSAAGQTLALRDITRGEPAAVIFWSKECGWALQALPQIIRVASKLHDEGVPVVLVAGDQPSNEVTDFLAHEKWTLPVYFDPKGEMKNAFSNFGTPAYYALDGATRIRFDRVGSDEFELVMQLEALRADERLPAGARVPSPTVEGVGRHDGPAKRARGADGL